MKGRGKVFNVTSISLVVCWDRVPREYKEKQDMQKEEVIKKEREKHREKKCMLWKLENVLKHKNCLDPQIKNYGSIDFTLTYTKCRIE